MIQAQPVPSPALRIAVLCPGFAADRIRRQPWHVADGLARGLAALGHDVRLLTDALGPRPAAPYPVETPGAAFGRQPGAGAADPPSPLNPSTGSFWSLVRPGWRACGRLALGAPVSLVMASPRLRLRELLRLGPVALWRERALLALPLINALLPGAALRAGLRRSGADEVVYLSDAARQRFARAGPAARPAAAAAGRHGRAAAAAAARASSGSAISARRWPRAAPISRSRRSRRPRRSASTAG